MVMCLLLLSMNRRGLLAALSTLGLSGCLRLQDNAGNDTATPTAPDGTPRATQSAVPGTQQAGTTTAAQDTDRPETESTETPEQETETSNDATDTQTESEQNQIASVDGQWAQFQRDASHSGTALDDTGPSTNPSVQWQTSRDIGFAWTQPVVANGHVFVASHTESDNSAIHAFDVQTGELDWYTDIQGWTEYTPTFANGTLFVGTGGDARIIALDAATGDTRWFRPLGDSVVMSPTFFDGSVYLGLANGDVYSINASDGAVQWENSLSGVVPAPPTVTDQGVYVSLAYPQADLETDDILRALVYYSDDQLQSVRDAGGSGAVAALSLQNGEETSRTELPAIVSESVAARGGQFYVGDWDGGLRAYDSSLEPQWDSQVAGVISTTPTVDDERVYIGEYEGRISAFSKSNGNSEWEFSFNEKCDASPVRVGDLLYAPTKWRNLYALLPGSGTARWQWAAEEGEVNIGVVDEAAFATSRGKVVALTPE